MLRDATGRLCHRPLDLDALRAAAEARAALLRAEHAALPPARDTDAAELVRRVEGLLRWHAEQD